MTCREGSFALYEALKYVFISRTTSRISSRCINSPLHQTSSRNIGTAPKARRRLAPVDPKTFGPKDYTAKPKDEAIPSTLIRIKDGRNLGEPQSKAEVLKSFDREKFFLVQTVNNEDSSLPICSILPREKVYEQERLSNTTKKQNKNQKEIEIPWKSADGDIDRKLSQAVELLEKGKKVNVELIARRPREIVRNKEEAHQIVNRIRQKIADMEGIRTTVDEQSVMGKSVTIHLESTAKHQPQRQSSERSPKAIEITWDITDDEIEKKKLRIEQLFTADVPVNLVINSRAKASEITEKDGIEILERVWKGLSQIPGIQEVKPRSGTAGKMLTLYLESNPA